MKTVSMVLCGAGGYGGTYVRGMLQSGEDHGVAWAGVVEPFPERVPERERAALGALGVPWYATLEEFYAERGADLCAIAAPIQFHAPMSITALKNGSHVLCEKPVTALPSEAAAMVRARDAAGKLLSIGYQASFDPSVRAMKRDIASGLYGKPVDLSCILRWPRDHAYFARGVGWAGKARDGAGRWVLDSVANNATAHYLHNMLFVLGGEGTSLTPDTLTASLYRANPIEMYDTAFITARAGGAAIRFITTHASHGMNNVTARYVFENGVIEFNGNQPDTARFVGRLNDGRAIEYADSQHDVNHKLWEMAQAIRDVQEGKNPDNPCPIEASLPHNRCMIAALISCPIADFPQELVEDVDGNRFAVRGLDEIAEACFDQGRQPLPSDAPWAAAGREVRLDDPAIDAYGVEP